jgi:hypothetical protein
MTGLILLLLHLGGPGPFPCNKIMVRGYVITRTGIERRYVPLSTSPGPCYVAFLVNGYRPDGYGRVFTWLSFPWWREVGDGRRK